MGFYPFQGEKMSDMGFGSRICRVIKFLIIKGYLVFRVRRNWNYLSSRARAYTFLA